MRLKLWVRVVLSILVIASIVILVRIDNEETRDAVNNCVNNGYTYDYCISGILG